MVAAALDRAGISYKTEDHPDRRGDGPTLDFELDGGLFIEVKRMHSPRSERQLAQAENVILAQGKAACIFLAQAIEARRGGNGEAGAVHESAVGNADAPKVSAHLTQGTQP